MYVTDAGGWTLCHNFSSLALEVWDRQCIEDSERKDDRPHYYWMNDKGVCRTAPATQSRLIICACAIFWLLPVTLCTGGTQELPTAADHLHCQPGEALPEGPGQVQRSGVSNFHFVGKPSPENFLFSAGYYYLCRIDYSAAGLVKFLWFMVVRK